MNLINSSSRKYSVFTEGKNTSLHKYPPTPRPSTLPWKQQVFGANLEDTLSETRKRIQGVGVGGAVLT